MESPTADEALNRLKQGNERFNKDQPAGPGQLKKRREQFLTHQQPFAIILSCSDSRVPPEMVFDTSLGDLFIIRVAGNVANASSIASIEYAVAHVGTKLVVVMAHQSCGAVGAAMEGGDAGKNLNHLLAHIQPALEPPGQDVDTVAKRNARLNADRLLSQSDIIRTAVENGGVSVVTSFYSFSSGVVEFDG